MSSNDKRTVWPASGHTVSFWQRATVLASVVCMISLQGCATTFVSPRSGVPLVDEVDLGDRVRVTTVEGEKREFVVTRVDEDGLYDREDYLRFDELAEIRIQQKTAGTSATYYNAATIILVIAGILVIFLVLDTSTDLVTPGS